MILSSGEFQAGFTCVIVFRVTDNLNLIMISTTCKKTDQISVSYVQFSLSYEKFLANNVYTIHILC